MYSYVYMCVYVMNHENWNLRKFSDKGVLQKREVYNNIILYPYSILIQRTPLDTHIKAHLELYEKKCWFQLQK